MPTWHHGLASDKLQIFTIPLCGGDDCVRTSGVQNQAVAIIITKQRGIAPESIRTNRAATRDLLPDNLPQHHPYYIGQ